MNERMYDIVLDAIYEGNELGGTLNADTATCAVIAAVNEALTKHLRAMEEMFGPARDVEHTIIRINGILHTRPELDMR